MPRTANEQPREYFVHATEDLFYDLNSVYAACGQDAADYVRDAMVAAMSSLRRGQWDRERIRAYGAIGTTFAFDFCAEYLFTFSIDTRFKEDVAVAEHYYVKNLLRKK